MIYASFRVRIHFYSRLKTVIAKNIPFTAKRAIIKIPKKLLENKIKLFTGISILKPLALADRV